MAEHHGYDELLESRVKQLQEIDERIAGIQWKFRSHDQDWLAKELQELRYDLETMVRAAKAESDAF